MLLCPTFPHIVQGVFSAHEEFGHLDGAPGSRVVPEWGYMGLDPTEDCPQPLVYSYGTYIASLCCGLQLGAAKNASIHAGVLGGVPGGLGASVIRADEFTVE